MTLKGCLNGEVKPMQDIISVGQFTTIINGDKVHIQHVDGEGMECGYDLFKAEVGSWDAFTLNIADNPQGAEWLLEGFYSKHF